MERILVTGGAGYVGQVLCGSLLDAGYHVIVLDSLIYGQTGPLHLANNPHFQFVYGDVRDSETVRKLIKAADIIIPLAALVGAPVCAKNPDTAYDVNYDAICNQAVWSDGRLIVYPTTNSGYGTQSGDTYCTEETQLQPISIYGQTKSDAERYLLSWHKNTITLRLATVFGMSPRMRLDLLVNDFTYRAFKDSYLVLYEPHFKRNYIHIKDVADCFIHCIQHRDSMVGRPYNVGIDSANCSKEELALKIKEHLPSLQIYYGSGTDPDKRNYIVSNQRLRDAGFEARRSLDGGIEELLKGFSMIGRGRYRNA